MRWNDNTLLTTPVTMTMIEFPKYTHRCNLTGLHRSKPARPIINDLHRFQPASLLNIDRDFSVADIICLFRDTKWATWFLHGSYCRFECRKWRALYHLKIFNWISLFRIVRIFVVCLVKSETTKTQVDALSVIAVSLSVTNVSLCVFAMQFCCVSALVPRSYLCIPNENGLAKNYTSFGSRCSSLIIF